MINHSTHLWSRGDEDDAIMEERAENEADYSHASTHDEGPNFKDDGNDPVLAKRETKAVCQTRLFVFLFLIMCTIGVALAVYFRTRQSESAQFEQQFHEDANKVLQSLGLSLDVTLGGIDALVVSFVSYAKSSNQTWPCKCFNNYTSLS
jgi:hypothetical protein